MENRKKLLVAFCVLFGGIVLTEPFVMAASKNNAKRAKAKSNKKKDKKKKGVTGTTSTPSASSSSSSSSSSRASSSALRAVATTTTTSSSSSVSQETEVYNLTEKLMSCLVSQCAGTVQYEKCFNTSQADVYMAGNSTCQTYLNAASSETVQTLAKVAVRNKITEYFKEACETAKGKVNGSRCEFTFYYYAKSPDGKNKKKRVHNPMSIGKTLTCSYQEFGLTQQDLEYKEEMTSDQKIAMATAIIDVVKGAATTGAQVVSTVKQARELKKKGHYLHDAWYLFDGTKLTKYSSGECKTYDYGPSGLGKDKELKKILESGECKGSTECKPDVDSNGISYIVKILKNEEACNEASPNKISATETYKECAEMSETDWEQSGQQDNKSSPKACMIKLEKVTELSLAEKQVELAKSTGYLEYVKAKADDAKSNLQWNNMFNQMALTGMATDFANRFSGNDSSTSGEYLGECPSSSFYIGTGVNDANCTSPVPGADANTACTESGAEQKFRTANSNYSGAVKCERRSGRYFCYKLADFKKFACKWDGDMLVKTKNTETSTSTTNTTPTGPFNYSECSSEGSDAKPEWCKCNGMVGTAKSSCENAYKLRGDMKQFTELSKVFSEENKRYNKDISAYNTAISSYNSANNSLNEKKKELQDMKEKANSSVSELVSSGSQTLFTGVTQIMTTKQEADSNKGIMTGSCWLGDPENGGAIFLQEGAAKKLTWKDM